MVFAVFAGIQVETCSLVPQVIRLSRCLILRLDVCFIQEPPKMEVSADDLINDNLIQLSEAARSVCFI